MTDVYFWRQALVVVTLFLHSLCDGVSLTFPGVVNAVILAPNSTDIKATPAEAALIASIPGAGAFIGIFLLTTLVQNVGRKLTYICLLTFDLLSWSILPFAKDVNTIVAARLIRGLGFGLFYNGLMVSEYIDPRRRGYISTLRKLCSALGALVSHTIALGYTFREISVFPFSCVLIAIILTFFWRESPAYNAYRGRFEECKKNFIYLHGNSKEKQEELENMMGAQMVRIEKKKKYNIIKTVLKSLIKKDFVKASVITSLLIFNLELCGKHYFLAYVNQIFLMIIGDKSLAAYCSILNDVLTIISLTLSTFVIGFFKRRTLVFLFGVVNVTLMFIISIAEFLKSKYSTELWWLVPSAMLALNVFVNIGVYPVNILIVTEIYPLESRGLGLGLSGLNIIIFTFVFALKVTPAIVKNVGLGNTFGIFGVGIIICMIILYYILPETKDRTMQDIEDEVKNVDKSTIELRPMLLKEKFEMHECQ